MLVEQVIWNTCSRSQISVKSDKPKGEKGKTGQEAVPPPSDSQRPLLLPHTPVPASPAHDLGIPSEHSMLDLSIHAVQVAASTPSLIVDSMDSSFHQPHADQPSPYLRKLCPLCFNVTLDKLKKTLKGLPDAEL